MLTYAELKKNARKFVSLTSLTPEEFEFLLPAFERAYLKAYPVSKTMTGKKRERKAGGGRRMEREPLLQSRKRGLPHRCAGKGGVEF